MRGVHTSVVALVLLLVTLGECISTPSSTTELWKYDGEAKEMSPLNHTFAAPKLVSGSYTEEGVTVVASFAMGPHVEGNNETLLVSGTGCGGLYVGIESGHLVFGATCSKHVRMTGFKARSAKVYDIALSYSSSLNSAVLFVDGKRVDHRKGPMDLTASCPRDWSYDSINSVCIPPRTYNKRCCETKHLPECVADFNGVSASKRLMWARECNAEWPGMNIIGNLSDTITIGSVGFVDNLWTGKICGISILTGYVKEYEALSVNFQGSKCNQKRAATHLGAADFTEVSTGNADASVQLRIHKSTYQVKDGDAYDSVYQQSEQGQEICTKDISAVEMWNSHNLCHGASKDLSYHVTFTFRLYQAIKAKFRAGGDFGRGVMFALDGKSVLLRTKDHWWGGNWDHAISTSSIDISAGDHKLEVMGFENCCDGQGGLQFQLSGEPWKPLVATEWLNVVPPPPGVTRISIHKSAHHLNDGESADSIRYEADKGNEICTKDISNTMKFSSHGTCGGSTKDLAYHVASGFELKSDATVEYRFGGDFGRGSIIQLDGIVKEKNSHDIWWAGDWNKAIKSGPIQLSAGYHMLEVMGFEGCCDGEAQMQFRFEGQEWKGLTSDSVQESIEKVKEAADAAEAKRRLSGTALAVHGVDADKERCNGEEGAEFARVFWEVGQLEGISDDMMMAAHKFGVKSFPGYEELVSRIRAMPLEVQACAKVFPRYLEAEKMIKDTEIASGLKPEEILEKIKSEDGRMKILIHLRLNPHVDHEKIEKLAWWMGIDGELPWDKYHREYAEQKHKVENDMHDLSGQLARVSYMVSKRTEVDRYNTEGMNNLKKSHAQAEAGVDDIRDKEQSILDNQKSAQADANALNDQFESWLDRFTKIKDKIEKHALFKIKVKVNKDQHDIVAHGINLLQGVRKNLLDQVNEIRDVNGVMWEKLINATTRAVDETDKYKKDMKDMFTGWQADIKDLAAFAEAETRELLTSGHEYIDKRFHRETSNMILELTQVTQENKNQVMKYIEGEDQRAENNAEYWGKRTERVKEAFDKIMKEMEMYKAESEDLDKKKVSDTTIFEDHSNREVSDVETMAGQFQVLEESVDRGVNAMTSVIETALGSEKDRFDRVISTEQMKDRKKFIDDVLGRMEKYYDWYLGNIETRVTTLAEEQTKTMSNLQGAGSSFANAYTQLEGTIQGMAIKEENVKEVIAAMSRLVEALMKNNHLTPKELTKIATEASQGTKVSADLSTESVGMHPVHVECKKDCNK